MMSTRTKTDWLLFYSDLLNVIAAAVGVAAATAAVVTAAVSHKISAITNSNEWTPICIDLHFALVNNVWWLDVNPFIVNIHTICSQSYERVNRKKKSMQDRTEINIAMTETLHLNKSFWQSSEPIQYGEIARPNSMRT